jgi:hypothetical protein
MVYDQRRCRQRCGSMVVGEAVTGWGGREKGMDGYRWASDGNVSCCGNLVVEVYFLDFWGGGVGLGWNSADGSTDTGSFFSVRGYCHRSWRIRKIRWSLYKNRRNDKLKHLIGFYDMLV